MQIFEKENHENGVLKCIKTYEEVIIPNSFNFRIKKKLNMH